MEISDNRGCDSTLFRVDYPRLIQNELTNISGVRQPRRENDVEEPYTAFNKALGQTPMQESARHQRNIDFYNIIFTIFITIFLFKLKHSIGKLAEFRRLLIS